MYKYEFTDEQIFTNRIKSYPEFNLFMYLGNLYVNKQAPKSGTTGGLQIYNINNNRDSSTKVYPFINVKAQKEDFRSRNPNPMIRLFSENFGYIGPNQFISSRDLGLFPADGSVTSSYPDVVPITRRYTSAISSFSKTYYDLATSAIETTTVAMTTTLNITASALLNSARKYIKHSKHFEFNSTALNRNILTSNVNYVFVPRAYYGSAIKKGTVILDYYITGSKIASCHDKNENGELIETTGSATGDVVGIVLYDEGVIMLTGSHTFDGASFVGTNNSIQYVSGSPSANTWMHYGATINDGVIVGAGSNRTLASASFGLGFKGTNYINTMTLLATAPKGHLNHSNNPTYKKSGSASTGFVTGSSAYYSEAPYKINNVVTSSHTSASFEKVTYLSKINIYDDKDNLIGVASMARPVKKTEDKEYIFKLKLDI